ncbi:FIG01018642: hypothetical protein [hydrothermal vent metagenome]|uniref:Uncharacterized protein n=1 Tax=hydrothermal vent metagenome TaxID=652676 RepID=A0A3B0TJZ9_9ZZZZ
MLLQKTNIEDKLAKVKTKGLASDIILQEVYTILEEDSRNQERIENTIRGDKALPINNFDFDLLESDKIYHIDHIERICIDYRLRFLDSKYFKGEIPQEAIGKIKRLEKQHAILLKGFKIIGPSKVFKLEDKDDPILFAPIGNGYFYKIHKWGNDLHPLRKLLMWPFKSSVNLAVLVLFISYLFSLLIPNGLFSKTGTNAQFWLLFFFTFKSISAIVIFYGFALGKNFSTAVWRSRYYNA